MDHPSDIGPQGLSQSSNPKIKICGVQQLSDALMAAEAGADFLGMVFVPHRRRRLDGDSGRGIVAGLKAQKPLSMLTVGLFADQPLSEVNHLVRHCGLDLVQLCGQEPLEYCGQIEVPVIKVVHVPGSLSPGNAVPALAARMAEINRQGHMITLDRQVEGLQGGTGQVFSWDVAEKLSREGFNFLLAGGLTPENVGVAVRTADPWGVDVSSGVETSGVKDVKKIRAFIEAVRSSTLSTAGQ